MVMSLNKIIEINNKHIGVGHRPYVIAEMACAHDGSFEKAERIINAAADANADCIQFQFFVAKETVTPNHEAFPLINKIEFDIERWARLNQKARKSGLDVFACTYDLPSVDIAVKLKVDGIKLNSADLSNPEVLKAVSESEIPFSLGTGASTLDEISNGVSFAINNGSQNIILMHGVQNFPTETKDLNISKMKLLKKEFQIPVGYADHTSGDDPFGKVVDLVAVGLGANVLEKHITIDRGEKGIDYQAALEPAEFKKYVETIKRGWLAYGKPVITDFNESDLKYRKFQKKSIVAIKDIEKEETITRDKVSFIRNIEPGIPPIEFSKINGKNATKRYKKYDNILMDYIK